MLRWLADRHGDDALRLQADRLERALGNVLAGGKMSTYDQGGTAKTSEIGDAVAAEVRGLAA